MAGAGQVVVVGTRDEALTVAAQAWRDRAATVVDPLQRVEQVTLMAGRREDGQVLNELARAHARADGHLQGEDVTYRLMSGGTLRLAQGETVLLRRNSPSAGGNPALTNGQRAVVEGIDADRNVALGWPNVGGGVSRVVLSPGDVVAGQIARSYLEADGVQGGAASTVHLAQGRTVEHAIAVLDPHQHAASYVALSRDRSSTTVVLSAEAVSDTPEDLAWLQQLPAAQRERQVLQRYASSLHQAGVSSRPAACSSTPGPSSRAAADRGSAWPWSQRSPRVRASASRTPLSGGRTIPVPTSTPGAGSTWRQWPRRARPRSALAGTPARTGWDLASSATRPGRHRSQPSRSRPASRSRSAAGPPPPGGSR